MGTNKYKKYHKQTTNRKNEKDNLRTLRKGFFGFRITESGLITKKQLEIIRRVITRITNRTGKIFLNINCNQPLTKKPFLSRMGKGTGDIYS
jgi:ribosomal protein L16